MSLTIDARRTALVLIDLQQGVISSTLTPHSAQLVVANAVRLGEKLHQAGGIIVPVHVNFAADGADRLSQPVDAPMARPAGGMPANWAELAPEVAALPAAFTITKHQWGAFHGTELDLQLRRRGITTIILGGVSTNFGVESTAREAWQHNYSVVLAEDASSAMAAEMHQFAIEKILPRLSLVRSTEEILTALG